ncbi:DUF5958 family protein [Streptomyces uncialis]|uniref:DUF5958 family protein n=1 Tax=Streptomyces uncialis TaxID=1048205 RepID=UPI0037AD7B6F
MAKEVAEGATSGRTIIQVGQTMQNWTRVSPMSYSSPGAGDQLKASERIINEVAQGLLGLEQGVSWFSSLEQVEQKAVLHEVVRHSMQAHATAEDGREGVLRSGVKPTANPAVLIVREPLLQQMGKIINLPQAEYAKAFRVLLSTFVVADTRRRELECRGSCSHAWHNLT